MLTLYLDSRGEGPWTIQIEDGVRELRSRGSSPDPWFVASCLEGLPLVMKRAALPRLLGIYALGERAEALSAISELALSCRKSSNPWMARS